MQLTLPYQASMQVGKRKYNLGMNLFYAGTHFAVRKQIVDKLKLLFAEYDNNEPVFFDKVKLSVNFYCKVARFDLDNKDAFWRKMFLDYAKGKYFEDDSTKYLTTITSNFELVKENERIEFTLYV